MGSLHLFLKPVIDAFVYEARRNKEKEHGRHQGKADKSEDQLGPELCADNILAAFQKEFGDAPGLTSDTAYDAMTILLRTLDTVQARDGKITGQAVRSVLAQTKNFPGVSGTISFHENGDVQSDVSFRTLEKGKFQDLPR